MRKPEMKQLDDIFKKSLQASALLSAIHFSREELSGSEIETLMEMVSACTDDVTAYLMEKTGEEASHA
ncbi:hypothetical protein [Rahnella sp. CJA17(1/100)]|uniref:hypothetical protein n=1 Tax=Rahnella sp. CJA17(1/100) TaxID=2508951 RepID=UPI00106F114D|nr:hypothetical protein [Rahnella sp. CJA17(1/100)]